MLSMNNPYTQDDALKALFSCAAVFFPKHFTSAGPLSA